MKGNLLVLNAGSSSIKGAVYCAGEGPPRVRLRFAVEGLGGTTPALRWHADDDTGRAAITPDSVRDHAQAFGWLLHWLREREHGESLVAVGHRIVHGADRYTRPVRIDADTVAALTALAALAPLHQAAGLAGIRGVSRLWPELPQVACFDTAFHRDLPAVDYTCALPLRYRERGLRRYGFHGLSCESSLQRLGAEYARLSQGRLIVAHLGGGTSLTAIANGKSVASTMGFSTLDGPPMSTRSGSLDPGILLYLLREGMTAAELEHLLYHDSGLRGLAGGSGDMRELLGRENCDPHAAFAVACFVYQVQREVGSLTAALGGLDALVFTGGIGQHSAQIRARVMQGLEWLGVALDPVANDAGAAVVTRPSAPIVGLVLDADEESVIAAAVVRELNDSAAPAQRSRKGPTSTQKVATDRPTTPRPAGT